MARRVPSKSLDDAVAALKLSVGLLVRRVRAVANTPELSCSQALVLARLERAGPSTTAELARLESVKPQSMGATLAALEEEGLVQRKPHTTDGRQLLFSLTKEGIATRKATNAAKQEWLSAAVTALDPGEQKILFAASD